jgi:hypothetical protein
MSISSLSVFNSFQSRATFSNNTADVCKCSLMMIQRCRVQLTMAKNVLPFSDANVCHGFWMLVNVDNTVWRQCRQSSERGDIGTIHHHYLGETMELLSNIFKLFY